MRLLLVEDEPLSRDMMRVALEQYGADLRAVASVEAAMEALERERPDAVLTDIAMAGEDGFSLRADERNRILLAGFDDYLQKPVQPFRWRRRSRASCAVSRSAAAEPPL